MKSSKCLISLGTNLGDRTKNLSDAYQYLNQHIKIIKKSRAYETEALLPKNAPKSWNLNYLNLVIYGEYDSDAESLIMITQGIEKKMGRDFQSPKWSPRIIDIDILIFSNYIIKNSKITIPHPEMLNRSFVMIPAEEVGEDIIHPVTNKSIKEEVIKNKERFKTKIKLYDRDCDFL